MVETENKLSGFGKISCGVPQDSILGPLLFLIYVNDMPQAVKSTLRLYADDSRLMCQHKNIAEIKKILNEDFENICDSLGIYFGDDKTKSILFVNMREAKTIRKLNIRYNETNIKQQAQVTSCMCIRRVNVW